MLTHSLMLTHSPTHDVGNGNSLNIKRLNDIAVGYSQFIRLKTDAKEGNLLEKKRIRKASLDPAVQSISQIILNDGYSLTHSPMLTHSLTHSFSRRNYVQVIIIEEAVRITDALSRSIITTFTTNLNSFFSNGNIANDGLFASLTRSTKQVLTHSLTH